KWNSVTYISPAGDYGEIAAAEIFYLAPVLQGRNDQRGDAAKYEHQTEVARRVGKAGWRRVAQITHAIKELDDREAESDQRGPRAHPRHQRALHGETRTHPSKMTGRGRSHFEPARRRARAGIGHTQQSPPGRSSHRLATAFLTRPVHLQRLIDSRVRFKPMQGRFGLIDLAGGEEWRSGS